MISKIQDKGIEETVESIKLGIDVHARFCVVSRQVDGATPQPLQKMNEGQLLVFAKKQLKKAKKVYTCYEAGAFGYHLHRKLERMGAINVVVQPQDWDERGKGVKTDRSDAQELCQRLDRYVRGNRKAFSVVRVPSEEQERERSRIRQRQQLVRARQRFAAQGRSLLAQHGIHVSGRWWTGRGWRRVREQADEWLCGALEVFARLIEPIEREERELTEAIEAVSIAERAMIPKGVGVLSFQTLRREVGDWNRFNNRREVSSFTGLCPREFSSGGKHRRGSVSKSGNPRVRAILVEMVWRMMRWQPNYHALRKWQRVFGDPLSSAARRKKAVVAVARQLAVDLWRLFTGQTTGEKLGLVYLPVTQP
jgi:transposase